METLFVTVLVCAVTFGSYIIFKKKEDKERKTKIETSSRLCSYYQQKIDNIKELSLVGVESDGNSDFEFVDAVKKTKLQDHTRVKIYD